MEVVPGSIPGADPFWSNTYFLGVGRYCTPSNNFDFLCNFTMVPDGWVILSSLSDQSMLFSLSQLL